jgi:iron complex outermembrane recepter protein
MSTTISACLIIYTLDKFISASVPMIKRRFCQRSFIAATMLCAICSQPLYSKEAGDSAILEEIAVIGSRNLDRSATTTTSPVDIIPLDALAEQSGQLDLGQLLQFSTPSFNSNRMAGSDGSDHIDAATLRGLGPDQVLVLVNGKRRHTSSLVNIFGSRARGNVGTDLNSIPVAAIERVEILRDGAAAQYGSDAIAGVINIVLKSGTGTHITSSFGQYSKGDGINRQTAIHHGKEFDRGGFVNISAEYLNRDKTDRSATGEVRSIGDADTENHILFFNTNFPVANGEIYSFGGYNDREGLAGAWARGSPADDPDRNAGAQYPNGFVPDISTDITDRSLSLGFRSSINDWRFDSSASFGSNKMEYTVKNTLNASLATVNGSSPTSFDAGGFEYQQKIANVDVHRFFDTLAQGINIAFGGEYRHERYEIFSGELGSYNKYSGSGTTAGGSQGFPGFQPNDEADETRHNIALYLDIETQLSDALLVATALRWEDYSDFGKTLTGKLAGHYQLNSKIALRGSLSSGFRAPSLQQRYFNSTFTDFPSGIPTDILLANENSSAFQAVGMPELDEETSLNATTGLTWDINNNLAITLDAYWIWIDDRIVLTGSFTDTDIPGNILSSLNPPVGEARFFTNAIDTKTYGMDMTISHSMTAFEGTLSTYLSLNYNKNQQEGGVNTTPLLQGKEDIYFGERETLFIEGAVPDIKSTLTVDYQRDDWRINLKLNYFGQQELGTWSGGNLTQTYSGKFTTDLSMSYNFSTQLSLTVGGTNIFDEYPDKQDPNETENGGIWESVQMGFNGAYFFTRITVNF